MKEKKQRNFKKIQLSLFHLLAIIIYILIVGAATYFLPLVNVIGYESSVLSAVLLSLIGGLSAIKFLKISGGIISTRYLRRRTWPFYLTLFIFSLLIPFASTRFLSTCPDIDGILFHLVISLPSLLIGIALGTFSFKVFDRFHYLRFILVFIIILLLPLIELYRNPQIYFYNPILGFFPGTIYDEDIQIDKWLLIYRAANLVFFRIVLFFAFMIPKYGIKFKISVLVILFILIPAAFSYVKPMYELATDVNRLERELKGEAVTENFIIRYPEDLSKENVENLILHHEYYFRLIPRIGLSMLPDKIESFIFKDKEQKRRLFGAGNADVAKPWLFQIYTEADSYSRTLKHEIAHVFSAEHGVTFLRLADNFNPALIEGYAMVLENNYDDMDLHYLARLAEDYGYKVDIKSLFTGFNFFGKTSSVAYIYSGSFLKYLHDKYGIKKLHELYGDLDFEKHYGSSIDVLADEYKKFLSKLKYTTNSATADLYFGYRPIFKKVCVRQRANDLRDAWKFFSEEKYDSASVEFKRIYDYSEAYKALVGYVSSLDKLGDDVTAKDFLAVEIEKFANTSYYFNLRIILGDLYIKNKSFSKANSIFKDLSGKKPNYRYYTRALLGSYLIRRGKNYAYNYVTADHEKKYEKLLQINSGSLTYASIPSLISLSKSLDKNPAVIVRLLSSKLRVSGDLSSYCAFYSSKYLVDLTNYRLARKFAVRSKNYCPRESKEVRDAQVDKINWFIKFGDSVLEKSVITN